MTDCPECGSGMVDGYYPGDLYCPACHLVIVPRIMYDEGEEYENPDEEPPSEYGGL